MDTINDSKENKAIEIADIMGRFMKPASSSDEALIRTVAEYALQLTPSQQMVLNKLRIAALNQNMNNAARDAIFAFIPAYERTKRYHDSNYHIIAGLEAVSLKRWVDQRSIQGQVIKAQNQ